MLDIFILIVVAWSLISGWRNGLLKEVVSTIGFLVGFLVAAVAYRAAGDYLAVEGSRTNMITSLLAFFLLWVVTPIVLGQVANLLTKVVKSVQLGLINSALGALVSFLKFFILLGCVLTAMSALGILHEERLAESRLYAPIRANFSAFVYHAFGVGEDPAAPRPANVTDAAANDTTWIPVNR